MNKFTLSSLNFFSGRIFSKQWMSRSMLWLVVLCASLLFLPEHILGKLGLHEHIQPYSHFVGLGLVIGCAYFCSRVFDYLLDIGINHYSSKQATTAIENKIHYLDPTERAVLREFFLQSSATLTLPKDDVAVKSLMNAHILECIGNELHYAIQGPTADFKITLKARSYLNRQILRLPSGKPNELELKQLIKARPAFIHSLVQQRKQAA
ncbi:superinfection exclusion B family protein [Shewanella sp. 202IG2-18]|uniref:superinfection exclusion B family protein n=1 Tax=Parashewanella hymeniacidonis TaxID=2807618 RepID=UPI00195F61F2|nr:superinfection exclusion B family protein [Parashewanella hymeniacidonis]MBM7071304.1 superinfection exclusion B family protein [Parashewanella hymeniacidonis]